MHTRKKVSRVRKTKSKFTRNLQRGGITSRRPIFTFSKDSDPRFFMRELDHYPNKKKPLSDKTKKNTQKNNNALPSFTFSKDSNDNKEYSMKQLQMQELDNLAENEPKKLSWFRRLLNYFFTVNEIKASPIAVNRAVQAITEKKSSSAVKKVLSENGTQMPKKKWKIFSIFLKEYNTLKEQADSYERANPLDDKQDM
jgi:hypothetical protein